MEENADKFSNREPHCKQSVACSNRNNLMEKLNINLTQATNYLVQLFYKTNQKYSCTRTKVGKLLSIVAFKYASNGQVAFEETIYKYNECGTAIKEIMQRFKDRDIYTLCTYNDDSKPVSQKIDEKADIPLDFIDIKDLSDDVKDTIKSVFLLFGAFSPATLGECINPIVNTKNTTLENNQIDISRIEYIHLDDFSTESKNPLIEFLFD